MFEELRNQLENLSLDSLLITSPSNIFYLTNYEGFSNEEREAVILITKKNNYLLTDRRYLSELNYLKNFKL
ncbi:MAG: aminopeptidase P family N-terminal domain-containing protein, partial [Patescibacteria group bacterium]|nr:aminopeptidase P family N-terminal domain-containing protein [Patescibacteria group bacterium]